MARSVLRVVSYNTLNGGRNSDGVLDRLISQMGMLRELEPDVVCLQEGKRWNENGSETLNAVAAALEMEARLAPSASHGCHLVTLVRPPRVRFVHFFPDVAEGNFHHTVSRADLQVEGEVELLRVLHTHLDPFDPADRAAEARWLTQYGDRTDTLLVGDLNSEAPGDPEPDTWDWLPATQYSGNRIQYPDGSYGGLDKTAMRTLLAAGFVDPAAGLELDFARTAGHWRKGDRDHRSDYILPSKHLTWRVQSYTVIDTPRAQGASDHLPVVADLYREPHPVNKPPLVEES
ncbi:endonuclease/exonuclease/phosphatase family protein [Streptomyces sp. NPDC020707]|uniref:endonuclease/exonuclease/phosphatase family protein n=1 Tax=Streptomyces sp. NPDC020707 TaxID=3365084 RepID=UPI00378A3421